MSWEDSIKYKDKKSGRFVYYNKKKKCWQYTIVHLAESDAKSPIVNIQEAYDDATVEDVVVDAKNVIKVR